MMRTTSMEEMTWPEVKAAADAGLPAVLPLGSTEQHGPHLPLNTDCVLAEAIARETAKKYELVVAPTIRYGVKSRALTGGGEGFPGTLSLELVTVLETTRQIIQGLARHGFEKICVQVFHYENAAIAWAAADLASLTDAMVLVIEDPMPQLSVEETEAIFGSDFGGWDREHAAHAETSLMMAVRPDLVREQYILDDASPRHPSWDVVPAPAAFHSRSGVLSRASKSNAGAGRRLLALAADRLAEALTTEFGPAGTLADTGT